MTQPGEVRIRRAVLSVSDKTGIVEFAKGLSDLGIELVSTGGTAQALEAAALPVRTIDDFTGFPEIMSGRVKTLHPKLYAGLLARRDDPAHMVAAEENDIEFVDLVCVNLYPFEETAARRGVDEAEVIENIDIGGPTMIRAAAKNFLFSAVVVEPESYDAILQELQRERRAPLARHPREPRRRGVRRHRALRLGDRALVRRAARRLPARDHGRLREGDRPRLRREPAPARRLLPAGRRAHARALDGAPARRARAVVQQRARPQLGAPARAGVRAPRLRDHQAQQPLRLRGRGLGASRPTSAPSRATRCRRSAAW